MTRSQSGRRLELRLQLVRARRHVEPHDQAVLLDERIAGDRGLDLVAGQKVEAEAELLGHLLLPLLDEAAGRDDQAALEVAADQQLLDQQPGHDGLAGAGIVGEQEAQRLARQHLAVDGGDLVRQRLDLRGADGEIGIEQVGEPDAVGLGRQPKKAAVGVEGVRAPGLDELERGLLAPIDEPLADPAVDAEHEVQRVRAEARDLNDLGDPGGIEPAKRAPGLMSSNANIGAPCPALCRSFARKQSKRHGRPQANAMPRQPRTWPSMTSIKRARPVQLGAILAQPSLSYRPNCTRNFPLLTIERDGSINGPFRTQIRNLWGGWS